MPGTSVELARALAELEPVNREEIPGLLAALEKARAELWARLTAPSPSTPTPRPSARLRSRSSRSSRRRRPRRLEMVLRSQGRSAARDDWEARLSLLPRIPRPLETRARAAMSARPVDLLREALAASYADPEAFCRLVLRVPRLRSWQAEACRKIAVRVKAGDRRIKVLVRSNRARARASSRRL